MISAAEIALTAIAAIIAEHKPTRFNDCGIVQRQSARQSDVGKRKMYVRFRIRHADREVDRGAAENSNLRRFREDPAKFATL
jgi:hypothetical protein